MTLDPHVAQLMSGLAEQGVPAFHRVSVEQVRSIIDTFVGLQLPAEPVAKVDSAHYVSDGHELELRIYTPESSGPLPVILYFHGGGFVAGSIEVIDEPSRAIANAAGAIVVAAQYRLAPEHRFPAATDDAWAALNWVADNIGAFGGDPARLVVMGDSAGGGLAAGVAQRAHDAGAPSVRGQVLIYPALGPDTAFPSREQFGEGYVISAADMDFFWENYLPDAASRVNPVAAPTLRGDLSGLPPALVLTTENEVLRDEGEDYARRLADAGVEAVAKRYQGLVHGVFWMSGAVPRCNELRQEVADFVARISAAAAVAK
ncbi:alpha/beta hydrolase [Gordonia metallireducens]|uniref:alpha/beta hydrolase n=1 Tax=Gordonia metallireducens TaxID=2897779 RepID=UPI001E60B3A1|nr:alpha/beta hydrolase [Gordonia metallireducens]